MLGSGKWSVNAVEIHSGPRACAWKVGGKSPLSPADDSPTQIEQSSGGAGVMGRMRLTAPLTPDPAPRIQVDLEANRVCGKRRACTPSIADAHTMRTSRHADR